MCLRGRPSINDVTRGGGRYIVTRGREEVTSNVRSHILVVKKKKKF